MSDKAEGAVKFCYLCAFKTPFGDLKYHLQTIHNVGTNDGEINDPVDQNPAAPANDTNADLLNLMEPTNKKTAQGGGLRQLWKCKICEKESRRDHMIQYLNTKHSQQNNPMPQELPQHLPLESNGLVLELNKDPSESSQALPEESNQDDLPL